MRSTLAASPCLLLASCITSVGAWSYPSGRYETTACPKTAGATVAVPRFLDLRAGRNKSAMAFWYVPVWPLGWSHFDKPEATTGVEGTTLYTASPCEDLARSLAVEMMREGMVKQAFYAGDYIVNPVATHVLRGTVRSYFLDETRFSYCISVNSLFLWGLGLPMGTSANGFYVELELVDRQDGRVLWMDTIYDSDDHIEGLYYGPEWYRFPRMWEMRLREKIGGLATALGAEPAPLPRLLAEEAGKVAPRKPNLLGVDDPKNEPKRMFP